MTLFLNWELLSRCFLHYILHAIISQSPPSKLVFYSSRLLGVIVWGSSVIFLVSFLVHFLLFTLGIFIQHASIYTNNCVRILWLFLVNVSLWSLSSYRSTIYPPSAFEASVLQYLGCWVELDLYCCTQGVPFYSTFWLSNPASDALVLQFKALLVSESWAPAVIFRVDLFHFSLLCVFFVVLDLHLCVFCRS